MTSPRDDDRFDWQAAEAELSNTAGPDAEVVDLDAARSRRQASVTPDDDGSDLADAPRRLVDSPAAQRSPRFTFAALQDAKRRPIVPAWLRSRAELRDAARWTVGHLFHAGAYHLTRTPKYAGKLAWRAPRGAGRLLTGWGRWLFDLQGEHVRQLMADKGDAEMYLKASKLRDQRVRWRGFVTAAVVLGVLPALGIAYALAPAGARYATLAALLAALGALGRPADKPLLDTAVMVPKVQKLTSDVVVRALGNLGITGINQAIAKGDRGKDWFPAPITRDGPGWRADVELPNGVTATEVIEKREKLAAGLGRPLGCVWPEGQPEVHPGRLVLWVGDQDMSKARKPVWPLLKAGTVDLFRPQPFGTDPRGRWVDLTLMFMAMVIGSIPRMGKTFTLREVLLIAALDPRAEIHAYDLKGTGDLSALEQVAHRYRAGEEDEDIEYAVAGMRELREELRRRAKVIRDLPRDLCPENKVTPELASKKSLGLHPLVIGVDECQKWFEHPEYGKELEAISTDLVKRGPALGIIPVFATQRPDAKSLPTGISANASTRFCLKVMGQTENDMVLGTSQYKQGIRATMFAWTDKGTGYFVGEGADARITTTVNIDGPLAEKIAARARAAREAAGRLTGHALGEQPAAVPTLTFNLLEDIAAVVPASEAKVWCRTVAARLAELRPEVYDGWDAERVTVALKPFGVKVGQTWGTDPDTGKGANRGGFERAAIIAAIAERNRKRDAS
ncbi:cell division protein FtsK [Micromonospora chersina]|uniref:cell division protein FtsK n=1 Tax=Micromonospora chersina TaxID=47854 RepID=UPI0037B3051E